MPEIKHQFTGGKMNKDVDERLVPNGEYRDAMNIQVSTSEGSDVGTVQNILGNTSACNPVTIDGSLVDYTFPATSKTVGSISDEKNDSFYWFVAGQNIDISLLQSILASTGGAESLTASFGSTPIYATDYIMKHNNGLCKYVLVDKHTALIENENNAAEFTTLLTIPDTELNDMIVDGMTVHGLSDTGFVTGPSKIITNNTVNNLAVPAAWETVINPSTTPVSVLGSVGGEITMSASSLGVVAGGIYINTSQWDSMLLGGIPAEGDEIMFLDPSSGNALVPAGTTITAITPGVNLTHTMPSGVNVIIGTATRLLVSNTIQDQTSLSPLLKPVLTGQQYPNNLGLDGYLDFGPSSTPSPAGNHVLNIEIITQSTYTTLSNGIIIPASTPNLSTILSNSPLVVYGDGTIVTSAITGMQVSLGYVAPGTANSLNTGCIDSMKQETSGVNIDDWIMLVNDCNPSGSSPNLTPPPSLCPGCDYVTFTIPNEAAGGFITYSLSPPLDTIDIDYLHFAKPKVLNFDSNHPITGINIIDDMLFWTDNHTEPKKINIPRSIDGTEQNGLSHTQLVNKELSPAIDINSTITVPLQEKHITVIKKSPKIPLTLGLITSRTPGVNYSGVVKIDNGAGSNDSSFVSSSAQAGLIDFSTLSEGDVFRTRIEYDLTENIVFDLPWQEGTKVVLEEFNGDDPPPVPITNYRIKGEVEEWSGNNFDTAIGNVEVSIRITSINGFPPTGDLSYAIDTFMEDEKLFEFKFPRFSYRYKYQDEEYSSFAPFTEVAFKPGIFNHHPKEGYNLGMTNTVTSVSLENFITQDTPLDVVSIDLLYKEDTSPNVYIVDTIKPRDQKLNDNTPFNHWSQNKYVIKNDTIYAAIASNQLLRSWDNVPRKALAQEVTGNRLVYGNYLQNYNLSINNQKLYPNFKHSIVKSIDLSYPEKSIKSLREYQLGVTFIDEYGRETPIISNPSGSFLVDKSNASTSNKLKVGLSGQLLPSDFKYYKFFIKETSGEYYNMAMDRFYDAEDGNYWLAFPSSDRNKVDIDTFLILKKGPNSGKLVRSAARYKIIAIENEAPDFIKTSKYNIGEVEHNYAAFEGPTETNTNVFGPGAIDAPVFGESHFHANADPLNSSTLREINDIKDDLYVDFRLKSDTSKVSNKYRITEVSKRETVEEDGVVTEGEYFISIDGTFKEDVRFVSDDPTGNTPTHILDGTIVTFYRHMVENKAKFDGRFFVKIYADAVFDENMTSTLTAEDYRTTSSRKVYFMAADHVQKHSVQYSASVFEDVTHPDFTSPPTNFTKASIKQHDPSASGIMQGYRDPHHPDRQFECTTNPNWFYYSAFFHPQYQDMENKDGDIIPGSAYGVDNNWKTVNSSSGGFGAYANPGNNSILLNKRLNLNRAPGAKNRGALDNGGDYEDVWFIDSGDYVGHHGYNGPYLGHGTQTPDLLPSSLWLAQLNTNLPYKKQSNKHGISVENGIGTMEISFGGLAITPEDEDFDDNNNSQKIFNDRSYNMNQELEIDRYYDLTSPERKLYNHESDFVNSMYSGKQFRWKEDPTGQVYTIIGARQDYNVVRYQRMGDLCSYTRMENFQKNYRFDFTPSIVGGNWNPTGSIGPITEGIVIDQFFNPAGSTTNLTTSTIKPSGQSYCGITGAQFKHTYDSTLERYFTIEKGMILTSVGGVALDPPVLVKRVSYDEGNDKHIIEFEGYQGKNAQVVFNADALVFKQPTMNGLSVNSAKNMTDTSVTIDDGIGAVGYTLEFIEPIDAESIIPEDAAIWETEPKESTDLDIYYEISGSNPIYLDTNTILTAIPIFAKVTCDNGNGTSNLMVLDNNSLSGDIIRLSEELVTTSGTSGIAPVEVGDILYITRSNGSTSGVKIAEILPVELQTSVFRLETFLYNSKHELNWFNCYAFGNGVESNRIRDNFNLPFIANGVKASTTFEDKYQEERRSSGLIYSGIYNSNGSVNNLNQFIQAEKITKDLNPIYGSIQKLHSRSTADGDLIALCEDRVLKILANKDALFNADGNTNIVSSENVLGTANPYSGDYGISKNPESFASASYRVYFTDKVRGAVIRLSKDGLTPISDYGMRDWFKDNLKISNEIIGSYDNKKDEYNVTLKDRGNENDTTVSFKEDVKGWVSFKSFILENGISCANEYYTFKQGASWKHHVEVAGCNSNYSLCNRNTFYGVSIDELSYSSFTVMLNNHPGRVKSFKTLNYEGSQSKVDEFTTEIVDGVNYMDGEYYNLIDKPGWYVESIKTDKEKGSLNEFIEKEGKWFNYIKGQNIITNNQNQIVVDPNDPSYHKGTFDQSSFAIQGIGTCGEIVAGTFIPCMSTVTVYGCTANGTEVNGAGIVANHFGDNIAALNYDSNASIPCSATNSFCVEDALGVIQTGTNCCCIATVFGCTEDTATNNYNSNANTDNGSCEWSGCTDPTAFNFVPFSAAANTYNNNWPSNTNFVDDGSCIATVYGCTDPTQFNYNAGANTDDGLCEPFIYGCTDLNAFNFNPNANTNEVSATDSSDPCVAVLSGCTNATACNFDITANTDDGSCHFLFGCTDPAATNYDSAAICDDNSCVFIGGCTDATACNYDPNADFDDGSCDFTLCTDPNSCNQGACLPCTGTLGCMDPTAINYLPAATCDDISSPCIACVYGCMDNTFVEFDPAATCDDGSCSTSCVFGCTDSGFAEYAPSATCDDGSCLTVCVYGCTDTAAFNTTPGATCDDGSCIAVIVGCTDPLAFNYSSAANTDDGSCIPFIYGCIDDLATNYDAAANTDDGSCCYGNGCTNPLACNDDINAAYCDDGSCVLPIGSNCKTITGGGGVSYECEAAVCGSIPGFPVGPFATTTSMWPLSASLPPSYVGRTHLNTGMYPPAAGGCHDYPNQIGYHGQDLGSSYPNPCYVPSGSGS